MRFAANWITGDRALDEMMDAAEISSSQECINLALGDPDLDTDPLIINAAFKDALAGYTHYAPARGEGDLIEAIQTSWREDLQTTVDKEEIVVTTSGCHAMWLLLTAILDPGDEVVIFSPYFSPYPEQIRLAGGRPVEVITEAKDRFVPSPQSLIASLTTATKAVIINSPCNPTGTILSCQELQALLDICIEYDLLLIADDIYTAYAFNKPFVACASLPQAHDNLATIRSFSKDYCMSGWRLGYVVAPSEVTGAMLKVNEANVYVAPTISQRAAYHALLNRKSIREQVFSTFKDRHQFVCEQVAQIPYLSMPVSDGGLYAYIDISRSGETSASFVDKLYEKYRVSVIPGTAFGSAGEGFIRMALRKDLTILNQVFSALAQDEEWLTASS